MQRETVVLHIPIQRVPLGFSLSDDANEFNKDISPLLGFLAGSAASGAPAVAPVGAPALHDNSLALRHDHDALGRSREEDMVQWPTMAHKEVTLPGQC